MYANGALWSTAHHRVPLLTVMHNNRGYGQETMLLQGLANRCNRGIDTARVGTEIDNPPIDYAKLADSMGVWSAGPITDPAKLAAALKHAVAVVKQGQPALVDVVTHVAGWLALAPVALPAAAAEPTAGAPSAARGEQL